ncbi:hypothetical protein [Pollutibacter soli]|uniref:hypothetical protein n=1 Tax=Pollutibacter soli TaxID=3034157 RepID=UPI0030133817
MRKNYIGFYSRLRAGRFSLLAFPSLFLALLFSGCLSKKTIDEKLVTGSWQLFDVVQVSRAGVNDSFSKLAMLKRDVKIGALFNFFKDSSYTVVKGNGVFEKGKWTLENSNLLIHLNSDNGHSSVFPISFEENLKGRGLLSFTDKKNDVVLKFIEGSAPLKNFKDDPFYAENNEWRFRPPAPEDSSLLAKRITNYLKHVALILNAATERKQDVVSFTYSQGPIKIYNGGIGIYSFDIVPEIWKKSFYSPEDAQAAYTQYEKVLEKSHYRGASSGNWVLDDYNILLGIYDEFTRNSNNAVK